jgi:hypothetical protein
MSQVIIGNKFKFQLVPKWSPELQDREFCQKVQSIFYNKNEKMKIHKTEKYTKIFLQVIPKDENFVVFDFFKFFISTK